MNSIQSWKRISSLFKPSSAKLFFLVTINALLKVYSSLYTVLWWLLGGLFIVSGVYYAGMLLEMVAYGYSLTWPFADIIYYSLWLANIVGIALMVRPSVKKKDTAYVADYIKHTVYFGFFIIIFLFVNTLIYEVIRRLWYINYEFIANTMWLGALMTGFVQVRSIERCFHMFLISPLTVYTLLFWLDSYATVTNLCKAFKRAIRMFFYTYPITIVLYGTWIFLFLSIVVGQTAQADMYWCGILSNWLIFLPLEYLLGPGYTALGDTLMIVLLPIPICFYTTIYVKHVHEEMVLYDDSKE